MMCQCSPLGMTERGPAELLQGPVKTPPGTPRDLSLPASPQGHTRHLSIHDMELWTCTLTPEMTMDFKSEREIDRKAYMAINNNSIHTKHRIPILTSKEVDN